MSGSIYAELGDIDTAIEYLNKTINVNPDNSTAYIILGHIKRSTGDNVGAINYLLESKKISPNDFEVHSLLGEIYNEMGEATNAIKSFENAVKSDAAQSGIWSQLGYLYQNEGDQVKAEVCFRSCLKLDDSNSTSSVGIIFALIAQDKYDEALTETELRLESSPDNYNLQIIKSDILEKQGQIEESFDIIQPYLESDTIHIDAVLILSRYCKELDLVEGCLELLEQYILMNSNDTNSKYVNKAIKAKELLSINEAI